ncbi:UNVERIFIED_CONTAM: hypothetical protein Slati_4055600 [Sesamum latifolium]|uniref:Uncharacterized protein n=1 Tax=Sesamum latifolium TaxID=2727402 RepID=A0AAW2TS59_9LAMI
MAPPFRNNTHHCNCSYASTAASSNASQPSLLVFSGGPAVGDIRSRCLRLSDQSTTEALAVRTLLGHRLPLDAQKAKFEWYDIVEGNHSLWDGVSKPYRETIRAFLAYFQDQILRRSDELFCFSNGSIGNFFFAGARIFFQSLDAAIFLFSRVSQIPTESLVLPVISTNDRLTLGCELWDGTIIRGQNEISHPTNGSMEPINKVFPPANPTVLDQLKSVDCIIFAMGSLFTSICPSLVLLGIGEIVSSRSCPKPSQYVNTIFVPKDGQIPLDIDSLAAQGIFDVVTVDSLQDSTAGILFDPKSLIQSLANLLRGNA